MAGRDSLEKLSRGASHRRRESDQRGADEYHRRLVAEAGQRDLHLLHCDGRARGRRLHSFGCRDRRGRHREKSERQRSQILTHADYPHGYPEYQLVCHRGRAENRLKTLQIDFEAANPYSLFPNTSRKYLLLRYDS